MVLEEKTGKLQPLKLIITVYGTCTITIFMATEIAESLKFVVSAPGKVIIFGEHAAVYGKPAIAAALSLRCFLLVTPSTGDSNMVRLKFPDIGLDHSWDISSIPWETIKAKVKADSNGKPQPPAELDPEIVDSLSPLLRNLDDNVHYIACFCFLYLYTNLCSQDLQGYTFVVRSTLPIGAGLGSSASTAVCLSAALSKLGNWIKDPKLSNHDHVLESEISELDFIDNWSLIGEKCFHGNPSGIDNAVATHGGAVKYQRILNSTKSSLRSSIRDFPPIKLLLTNTKVPKSTAKLVAGVGELTKEFPDITNPILNAVEFISEQAYEVMHRPQFGKQETATLRKLVNMNHGLLVALGVSHPALETVKIISDKYNLGATKLTGAGGGGCAITLVDESIDESVIHNAMKEYENEGFESFETSLGGKGVGMLFEDDCQESEKFLFSLTKFCGYKNRLEIENALGVENVLGWKFW